MQQGTSPTKGRLRRRSMGCALKVPQRSSSSVPIQGERNGRHGLSRGGRRLRATPSPRDIKQSTLGTEPGEGVVDTGEGGRVLEVAEGVLVHGDDRDGREQVEHEHRSLDGQHPAGLTLAQRHQTVCGGRRLQQAARREGGTSENVRPCETDRPTVVFRTLEPYV